MGEGTKLFPLGGNGKGGENLIELNKFVTKILKYNIAFGQGGKKWKSCSLFFSNIILLRLIPCVLLTFSLQQIIVAQQETYTIKKAPFSSDEYDEYSPVFYKNGIVFCTNRNGSLSNYSSSQNKRLFKINFIDTTGKVKWQNSKLFSKSLKTKLNDGPVTFNIAGDTIYYSRNLEVDNKSGNLSSARNKLGIFYAIKEGKDWTKIRELRSNNEWYNVTTPWLSPDGKRLYFASDKPDGFGGSDLYYCQWKGDYWDDPVNLGPVINTAGNEAYPFINPAGELFFASDGHPGLGGKDIFFSRFSDSNWLTPVRLDAPINSQYDDFGIITDSLIAEGYFSSNRDKSLDIFHFETNFPQIFYATAQKENTYCFSFSDSGAIVIDTLKLKYLWDFGDGTKASGAVVKHCFKSAGQYSIRLDIMDRSTGNLFFSKLAYNLDLRDYVQPYINSQDAAITGEAIDFDGLKSNLPGYEILGYVWDFGDGTRLRGESVKHTFKETGEYLVNLGVTLKSDSSGNIHNTGVTKKISIVNDQRERNSFLIERARLLDELPDVRNYSNAVFKSFYSAEKGFAQSAVFQVELLSSKTKIEVNSNIFRNVPKKYEVKEFFNQVTGTYSYIADRQINLMATYIAYKEMLGYGFKEARTKIEILQDPAAKELNSLKKIFGVSTDSYFDRYGRLTSTAYLLLDQVTRIMNKYPEIRLEVAVHSDNTGSPQSKLSLSQRYAKVITDYLINKGIDSNRLISKGFGGTRPIAPNYLEKDRALNRRVDFNIIRE